MGKILSVLLLLLCSIWIPTQAQLCNGSLGDPVARIDFGQGTDIGPALSTLITNYTFLNNTCPNDGFYTISNNSSGCFSNTWHTITQDHTPDDINGKFMLVNASNAPGVFYLDTVKGLCGGTTFEFSTFIINVLRPNSCNNAGIDPNLTFTIEDVDGTILTTYNTGDIAEQNIPDWVQYGTFFQTPQNINAVVLRIRNNAPGGCGNDLALDDISFRPCGPQINAVMATNNQPFISICEDVSGGYEMQATYSNGYADPRLQWQTSIDLGQTWNNINGATTTSYTSTVNSPGTYQYRLLIADGANISNPVCRIASKPITIQINPLPNIQAVDSLNPCAGTVVNLNATGGKGYQWTGPAGFSSAVADPVITNINPGQAGLYRVTAASDSGCVNRDSTWITVRPAVNLVANASQSLCEGDNVQLNASGGTQYRWEPAAGLSNPAISNPIASPAETTLYTLFASNLAGCADTGQVTVTVLKRPEANAGPDLWTINGTSIQLQGSASGTDLRYSWTPASNMNAPDSLRPYVTLTANGFLQVFTFRLEVISNAGCGRSMDEMTVSVFESLKVPNTFTPNGDGYNDTWEIELLSVFNQAVVEVYNTTGSLVYRSVGYNQPWDGKRNGQPLPAGTYYYTIDLKSPNAKKLAGYITIFK